MRKAAAWGKVILLSAALAVGVASKATATQIVVTDASWLATNAEPAPTWNSDPSFDTTGWINATVFATGSGDPCWLSAHCIWYDGQFSATQSVWLRKTFTISDPISAAALSGGIDDDADIYVNGVLAYSDHNGFAEGALSHLPPPLDLTPYLVQGDNLIAVAAVDFSQSHIFVAQIEIETPDASVPEPASFFLVASGLAGLTVRRRRKPQN